jgi:hypothetical protein|tara:strand:- start:215 stop:412 length:198 start_codon:yes stop_codon:yes gene_type:complete
MKNKTYNLKLTKDELTVLDLCLFEYHSLLAEKCYDEDVSMQDDYYNVVYRISNIISKIDKSDRGL